MTLMSSSPWHDAQSTLVYLSMNIVIRLQLFEHPISSRCESDINTLLATRNVSFMFSSKTSPLQETSSLLCEIVVN